MWGHGYVGRGMGVWGDMSVCKIVSDIMESIPTRHYTYNGGETLIMGRGPDNERGRGPALPLQCATGLAFWEQLIRRYDNWINLSEAIIQ